MVFVGSIVLIPWVVLELTKDLSADVVAVPLSIAVICVWFIRAMRTAGIIKAREMVA